MPIVPVFGGGGGSTPSPTPAQWLDVPTQVVQIGGSSTSAHVLATPTNGVGPYTYKVLRYNNTAPTSTCTVSGNILEITETTGTVNAGQGASAMGYRVMVWDSAGNFGVGVLFVYQSPAWAYQIHEDKLLETYESPDGYVFAGPRNPPAGHSVGVSYAPTGDGFSYPFPSTTAATIGDRLANCPPGGMLVLMWGTTGPVFTINLLVLRRKIDLTTSWTWKPTLDFIDWNNLSTYSPSIPIGTGSAFTANTEVIAATGKSYNVERACYTQTAGLAPTFEQASISGGVAVLETQNTLASTRVVTLQVRPALMNSLQAFREGTLGLQIGLMIRCKATITLTGDGSSVDLRWGKVYATTAGAGIRISSNSSLYLIGGQPTVRVHGTRTSFLLTVGTFRKSVFAGGQPIGVDFTYMGGKQWVMIYPWDPAWTDYPEWDERAMILDVPGAIGPIPVEDRPSTGAINSPYSTGTYPIYSTGDTNNWSSNNGILLGATQGNTANSGAKIQVEDVRYLWTTMNLGVAR